ncbi:MAG: hypothetical protein CME88_12270 [Hirschia sp.]|nr:hypothetical protein [Hirschia sp.]MBF19144.1 hypothetical protein [Hirschia sp.]
MMTRTDRTPPQAIIFLFGALSGALIAVAMWGMLIPQDPTPHMFPNQDKLLHFLAFAAMAGPASLILPVRYLGFMLSAVITVAGGVEIIQAVTNIGRQGDVMDFLAGAFGAVVACAIGRFIVTRFFPA